MKIIKSLRDIVKRALEQRIGIRMMDGYDSLIDKKDDIEEIKKEVVEIVGYGEYCCGEEIRKMVEELIQRDEDCIRWIKLARLYGDIR